MKKEYSIELDYFSLLISIKDVSNRKVVGQLINKIMRSVSHTDAKDSHSFSLESKTNLEMISKLATYLYIFGDVNSCLNVCKMLDDMEFTGNYVLWDYIRSCRMLICEPKKNCMLLRREFLCY